MLQKCSDGPILEMIEMNRNDGNWEEMTSNLPHSLLNRFISTLWAEHHFPCNSNSVNDKFYYQKCILASVFAESMRSFLSSETDWRAKNRWCELRNDFPKCCPHSLFITLVRTVFRFEWPRRIPPSYVGN